MVYGNPDASGSTSSVKSEYHPKSPIKHKNAVLKEAPKELKCTISPPKRMCPVNTNPLKTAKNTTMKWKISAPARRSVFVTT
jgi:hypothetical protein